VVGRAVSGLRKETGTSSDPCTANDGSAAEAANRSAIGDPSETDTPLPARAGVRVVKLGGPLEGEVSSRSLRSDYVDVNLHPYGTYYTWA